MATIDMGPKGGDFCVPFEGELQGPCLTQCGLGRGLLPYQVASSSIQPFGHNKHGTETGGALPLLGGSATLRIKWRLDPFSRLATIDMDQKLVGAVPFLLQGAGSPSNTKSPGPRHTSVPSGILVHPAVWPQRTLAENWGLCAV